MLTLMKKYSSKGTFPLRFTEWEFASTDAPALTGVIGIFQGD